MAEILIASGMEPTANPRVVKAADALVEAGHRVTVLGAIHSVEAKELIDQLLADRGWKHVPVVDASDGRPAAQVARLLARTQHRLSRELKTLTGWESPLQISPVMAPLAREALRRPADLTILNAEPSLWAGVKLLQTGRRVAIDFEDWYSEDLLPEDRSSQPIQLVKDWEKLLLKHAAFATTTSEALAAGLFGAYGFNFPTVVHNTFPTEERNAIDGMSRDRTDLTLPSVTWFSQTVGPGRGLEQLIGAMAQTETSFQLHIRGTPRPGYKEVLSEMLPVPLRSRLHFHGQVPQHELLSRLAEHDIGFCGESDSPASRNLTITNKMFEYLRAGLAVVATDTAGQREVADVAPVAVRIVQQSDAAGLAREIENLLRSGNALEAAKKAAREALETHFDWKFSKLNLQNAVRAALLCS